MNPHLRTNAADNEVIGGIRKPDATIVVSICPIDGTSGHSTWNEIARWDPRGNATYADGAGGSTWTQARLATVEQLLWLMN